MRLRLGPPGFDILADRFTSRSAGGLTTILAKYTLFPTTYEANPLA
jgi:hypothetical protein